MKALFFIVSLMISAQSFAAQEGYGGGHGVDNIPTGNTVVHQYNCSTPSKDGEMIAGIGYSLSIGVAAIAPQSNIRGISLKSKTSALGAQWKNVAVKAIVQNEDIAQYGSDQVKITIFKRQQYSAVVQFANGNVMNCVW
ncbi:MAG TPA: hypothetical protein VN132_03200 [Bdellovibrio sp.]|nr:hypothetical protein [Bdellovibrio sp.]